MPKSGKSALIVANDLLDELRAENERLLQELVVASNCYDLLQRFRNNLKTFNNRCKCEETIDNKLGFNALETDFKFFDKQFRTNQSIDSHCSQLSAKESAIDWPKVRRKGVGSAVCKGTDERVKRLKRIEIERQIIRQIDSKRQRLSQSSGQDCSQMKSESNIEIISGNCGHQSESISMLPLYDNSAKLMPFMDCTECELKFCGKRRLLDHMRNSHPEIYDSLRGLWKCNLDDCPFESDRFRALTIHKMRHMGHKPFKCDWPGCDMGFYRNNGLVVHRASHEGLKNFKCDWPSCGQTFRSKVNLRHHCLIHTNEKPYHCEWPGCEATFRSSSSQKRHNVVHRGNADYHCNWPNCGKSFKFKGSLNRHYVLHESDKSYKCQSIGCETTFFTKKQMTAHLKQIHNILI